MRRFVRSLWAWSWAPGLFVLVAFGAWFTRTLDHFVQFGVRREVGPFRVELGDVGREQIDLWWRAVRLSLRGAPASDSGLRSIRLRVEAGGLARLDADLPYSGRRFVDGHLAVNGDELPVDLRYRGDTYAHWGGAKKSLRVRTPEERPFEGTRRFNLVAPKYPEQLNNWLSYRLAHRLGLLAPRAELVNVVLDGRPHGLYVLTDQIDGDWLRAMGREPGDLYVGELLMRDAWFGVPNELFTRATLWEKAAHDPARPPGDRAPLEALLHLVNTPADERVLEQLGALVDLDAFARLAVLELLTQSHHIDHFHNWKLYWDPGRRRFEPVAWDVVGWIEEMRPSGDESIDVFGVYSPLHALLHRHAGFLVARDRVLVAFFREGGDRALLEELERARASVASAIRTDPHLRPPDEERVIRAMTELAGAVEGILGEVRAGMQRDPQGYRWRTPRAPGDSLLLSVTSARPTASLELRFTEPVAPSGVRLRIPRPEGPQEIDLAGRWRGTSEGVLVDLSLCAELGRVFRSREDRSTVRNTPRAPLPTTYALVVEGVDMRQLVGVRGGEPGASFDFTPDPTLRPGVVRDLYGIAAAAPP